MKISEFMIMNGEGDIIKADAYGDNLAFCCEACAFPVICVCLENQRGFDENHPALCKGCGASYFLDIRERMEKVYVFRLQ